MEDQQLYIETIDMKKRPVYGMVLEETTLADLERKETRARYHLCYVPHEFTLPIPHEQPPLRHYTVFADTTKPCSVRTLTAYHNKLRESLVESSAKARRPLEKVVISRKLQYLNTLEQNLLLYYPSAISEKTFSPRTGLFVAQGIYSKNDGPEYCAKYLPVYAPDWDEEELGEFLEEKYIRGVSAVPSSVKEAILTGYMVYEAPFATRHLVEENQPLVIARKAK